MRINTVRLKNFGPYEDATFNFNQGLVGIVGSNGSGKSTLVNGIYSCLTNDFSRFHGVKADIIRDTAPAEAKSFVEVSGEHEGVEFLLRRGLRPNSAKLVIAGEREYRKAGDISERLVSDVGLHRKLIDAYVFVDQWDMFKFLSQTDSKRAESFRYLCGTEKSVAIHDACTAFIADLNSGSELVDNSDDLTAQINSLSNNITEEEDKREKSRARLLPDKSLAGVNNIIRLFSLRASLETQTATNEKALELLVEEHAEHASAVTAASAAVTELEGDYEGSVEALASMSADKALWASYSEDMKRYKSVMSSLESLEEPVLDLSPSLCPTCGQEIAEEDRESVLRAQYEKEMVEYTSKRGLLADQLVKPTEPSCNHSPQEIVASQEDVKDFKQQLAAARLQQKELDVCASSCKERVDLLRGSLADDLVKLDSCKKVDDSTYSRAKKRLQEHKELESAISESTGRIEAFISGLVEAQSLLEQLRERIKARQSVGKLKDDVSEVRDLFHWQNIPKIVAQANLAGITGEVNEALAIFGDPFWVESDENLSFKVHFPSSPSRNAGALSGGQKAVLAICFRIAVNKLFGSNVGMMFLDEPTAGLDNENIEYFREALQLLAVKVRGRQQVVIITHATELQSTFDQVVSIET
jgi:DNA repair exonuclease SbcCD ATPase subunit